jgi:prevent-host-death family protein
VKTKPKTVGIRVLKDRLSAYVRAIESGGQEVVITDRGRAVARLVSLDGRVEPRAPLRIRPAVKDHSDLRWLKERPKPDRPRVEDIASALSFSRGDSEVP